MRPVTSRIGAMVIGAALLAAAGCGGEDSKSGAKGSDEDRDTEAATESGSDAAEETPEEQMQRATREMAAALDQANKGKKIEAVDFRKLKELLPDTISGAKRTDASGERQNAMGMDISKAQGRYETESEDGSGPSFSVEITDVGNASGIMAQAYAPWSVMQFDRETDNGYEKTIKYEGFPGHERYDTEGRSGSFDVFVAKRFLVHVEGDEATSAQIRAGLDALDLGKLAALAD